MKYTLDDQEKRLTEENANLRKQLDHAQAKYEAVAEAVEHLLQERHKATKTAETMPAAPPDQPLLSAPETLSIAKMVANRMEIEFMPRNNSVSISHPVSGKGWLWFRDSAESQRDRLEIYIIDACQIAIGEAIKQVAMTRRYEACGLTHGTETLPPEPTVPPDKAPAAPETGPIAQSVVERMGIEYRDNLLWISHPSGEEELFLLANISPSSQRTIETYIRAACQIAINEALEEAAKELEEWSKHLPHNTYPHGIRDGIRDAAAVVRSRIKK